MKSPVRSSNTDFVHYKWVGSKYEVIDLVNRFLCYLTKRGRCDERKCRRQREGRGEFVRESERGSQIVE